MSSTNRRSSGNSTTAIRQGNAIVRISAIPSILRFPLVVVLSAGLSTFLYSLSDRYGGGDLGSVFRSSSQWQDVARFIGWQTIELGLGWFGDYDGDDLAALSLLSHGPSFYLQTTFYQVKPLGMISSLSIDILAVYVPFRLLRPISPPHLPSQFKAVPNHEILISTSIGIYTTILAASIYSLTLYTAYSSYLPIYLVTYFPEIPTIESAHSSTPLTLFPLALLVGVAARSFIFTPAAMVDATPVAFNPETATLAETFWYNVWGYDERTKMVVKRTVVLILLSGGNNFMKCFWGIKNVGLIGAIAYAGVWAVAAAITGFAFGVVGAV